MQNKNNNNHLVRFVQLKFVCIVNFRFTVKKKKKYIF